MRGSILFFHPKIAHLFVVGQLCGMDGVLSIGYRHFGSGYCGALQSLKPAWIGLFQVSSKFGTIVGLTSLIEMDTWNPLLWVWVLQICTCTLREAHTNMIMLGTERRGKVMCDCEIRFGNIMWRAILLEPWEKLRHLDIYSPLDRLLEKARLRNYGLGQLVCVYWMSRILILAILQVSVIVFQQWTLDKLPWCNWKDIIGLFFSICR